MPGFMEYIKNGLLGKTPDIDDDYDDEDYDENQNYNEYDDEYDEPRNNSRSNRRHKQHNQQPEDDRYNNARQSNDSRTTRDDTRNEDRAKRKVARANKSNGRTNSEDNYNDINFETKTPSYADSASNVINYNKTIETEIIICKPLGPGHAFEVADFLITNRSCLVNLEKIQDDKKYQQTVDIMTGAAYALNSEIQQISTKIFLICPIGVRIAGELAPKNIAEEYDNNYREVDNL